MLIHVLYSFVSFLIIFTISAEPPVFIRLTDYSGFPLNQVLLPKKDLILVFVKNKAFTYDQNGYLETITEKYTSYISNKPSTVLQRMNQEILYACGINPITMFDSNGDFLRKSSAALSIDGITKCSLSVINPQRYLFSFHLSSGAYQIDELQVTGDNTVIFYSKITITEASSSSKFICEYFTTGKQYFCLYNLPNTLQGILIDSRLFSKQEESFNNDFGVDYAIIRISDTQLAVFAINEIQFEGILYTYTTSLSKESPLLVDLERTLISLAVAKLSDIIFMYCANTDTKIFIHRRYLKSNFPKYDEQLIIDDTITSIATCSIGVFSLDRYGIIVTNISEGHSLVIFIGFCINKDYVLAPNDKINFINLLNPTYVGRTASIKFKSRTPSITDLELSGIVINDAYTENDSLQFINRGNFLYTFIVTIDSIESEECTITVTMCYETCETCSSLGTESQHDCIKCQPDLYFLPTNDCVKEKPCDTTKFLYYIDDKGINQCLADSQCDPSYPYLINNSNQCIDSCPTDTICQRVCPLCPPNTFLSQITCNCMSTMNDITKEMEDFFKNDILTQSNPYKSINWGNSTIEIFNSSSQQSMDLNKQFNTSTIKNGEFDRIKIQCNIPLNDEIIIFKNDTYIPGKIVNRVEYILYDKDGNILDCNNNEDILISMTIPIANSSVLEYQQSKNLSLMGIDPSNPNDPFFSNICFKFETNNKTDIPRRDRYEYYLQDNASLCPSGCDFNGIDYKKNEVNCSCKGKVDNNPSTFDQFTNSFINSLLDGNWEVVTCYQLVFDIPILKLNYGHWIIAGLFFIEVIVIISYCCIGIASLLTYLTDLIRQQSKDKIGDQNNKVDKKKNNKEIITIKPSPRHSVVPMIQGSNKTLSSQRKSQKFNNNLIDFPITHIQLKEESNTKIKTKGERKKSQKDIQVKNKYKEEIERCKEQQATSHKYTNKDYNRMDYDSIILYDDRNFFKHYWCFLQLSQPIINTFFLKTIATHRIIKIAMFIFGITLDLTMSSFFYSDSYISSNYNGKSNFLTDIPVSLYCFCLSSLIGLLLNFLISIERGIAHIQKEELESKRRNMIPLFIRKYKVKIAIFFIIKSIFEGLFWYYSSAFCAVYQNSQVTWIISSAKSFAIGQSVPFAIALICTIIQQICLKCHCRCLYRLLQFVMNFL